MCMGVSGAECSSTLRGCQGGEEGWSWRGMPEAGGKGLGNWGWVQNFGGTEEQHDIC